MASKRLLVPAYLATFSLLTNFAWTNAVWGEQPAFAQLITSETAKTFATVLHYVPAARGDDRKAALHWLFQTATEFGWESQLLEFAESYSESMDAEPNLQLLAEQVRMLGLAHAGKSEEAIELYSLFLRKLRLRSSAAGSDFGQTLAMQFQLANDRDAARAVYEKLSSAFFLNAEIKDWCERRTMRLELSGQLAPAVAGESLSGEAFQMEAWKGRFVLIDFWATNCRPCLDDLPRLKENYTEFHPLGLEMVGISFDEDDTALSEFVEKQKIPWTILRKHDPTVSRFHVELIPCLVLLDRESKVLVTDVKVSHLRGALRKLLVKN